MTDQPDFVDINVGQKLRARRREIGQSQTALGEALGVSFQQVQKYENGVNRVSASMLYRAAKSQGVEPAHYFEDLDSTASSAVPEDVAAAKEWLSSAQAWALAQACTRMSPQARAGLVQFARDAVA